MDDDLQVHFDMGLPKQSAVQKNQAINEKAEKKKNKYQGRHLKGKQVQQQPRDNKFQNNRDNNRNSNFSNSNTNFASSKETYQQQQQQQKRNYKDKEFDNKTIESFKNQGIDEDNDQDDRQKDNGENNIEQQKLSRKIKKEKYIPKNQKKDEKLSDKFVQYNKDSKQKATGYNPFAKKNKEQIKEQQEEFKELEQDANQIYQLEKKLTGEELEAQKKKDMEKSEIFTAKKFTEIEDLHKKMQSSLAENKFENLTNIQTKSYIPIKSKANVAVKSETGSGKTLAYLVPTLNDLMSRQTKVTRDQGMLIMVIVPTRELAVQCMDQAQKLLHWANNIICGGIIGGENPQKEKAKLRKGINVLFGTPGRLLYHLKNTESFKLSNLETIIFEEADRTLDMGFKKDLEDIINILKEKINLEKIQKLLISAHYNEKIEKLYLHMSDQPIEYVGFQSKNEEIEEEDNQFIQIEQDVKVPRKLKQYYAVIPESTRVQFLICYLHKLLNTKTIIFLSTCSQVEYFELLFNEMQFKNQNGEQTEDRVLNKLEVFKLHGNIDQKLRTETYFKFKNNPNGAVLLSTDVAARGLDFPEVTHTILFEIPPTLVDYCNRIGRTARMDKQGVSILVLNQPEEEFAIKLKEKGLDLQQYESKMIFDQFTKFLKREKSIGMFSDVYLQGLTQSVLKGNKDKQALARSAYVSSLRAYARLTDRTIFRVKALNLQNIARSYGLREVKSKDGVTQSNEYQERLEKVHKNKMLQDKLSDKYSRQKRPRQALNIKQTMIDEFM